MAASQPVIELDIESLGARGDGVAALGDGTPIYVPYAAVGDRLRVVVEGRRGKGLAARIDAILRPGPGRAAPPCRHFGRCGGCALQHLDAETCRRWKAARIATALRRRGVAAGAIEDVVAIPSRTRRRAALVALHEAGGVRLGFHARASREVVDLGECHVLAPRLSALLAPLRRALAPIVPMGKSAEVALTASDTGIDLLLAAKAEPSVGARQELAALAAECDLARIAWRRPGAEAEPIVQQRQPQVRFGGVAVDLPPGAFLQPSAEGEAALVKAVSSFLPRAKRVADLFAGCGTFAFSLAKTAGVHAVEGDRAACEAMAGAARRAGLAGRVTVERRDLEAFPLTPAELDRFDAVVFDPPRAGAPAQAAALARSAVPVAIAVSCDPESFARDARALVDGGYRLARLVPIDQFAWSAHVELIARFER
jgi:23S rRNA (uracil1939-C5)-methyltransferase